ncbi:MAG: LLM class F420-dependent oxidoreductase [Proteobacteria bacterium]|nr:MAG: LLM class F420-dependent oxidoreductase [Pseudomonadota bacterium]
MDIGIHIVNFSLPAGSSALASTLGDIAEAAEKSGITHLSLMDHFFQLDMLGGGELEMLEGYTTLGYLAAKTSKIRLGLLVTGVTYRHPGLLAKIVSTLDVLSGGRADFGIGAAWYDREHLGLGVPYPPLAERFERLEETLQICLQMWSDNDGPYNGRHYTLAETRNVPQSVQRPHPPIMIGGGGERKTLRLVAKYADACNLFSDDAPVVVEKKLAVLREHCATEQRDYDTIQKTILYLGAIPAPDAHTPFIEEMRVYRAMGIDRVILMPGVANPVEEITALAPTVIALATL